MDALRIDLGPGGKANLGDRATFATRFQRSGPAVIAKALDNRFGVATLIELVRNAPANIDLLAAFTVQEEIGLRGAKVAAYAFNPDLGIAVDATPANDLPDWDGEENTSYNTKLGLGPAIYVADGATLLGPAAGALPGRDGRRRKNPLPVPPAGRGRDGRRGHSQGPFRDPQRLGLGAAPLQPHGCLRGPPRRLEEYPVPAPCRAGRVSRLKPWLENEPENGQRIETNKRMRKDR